MVAKKKKAKQFSLDTALGEAFRYGFTDIPRIFKITWLMFATMIALFAAHTAVMPVTVEELRANSALFYRHVGFNAAFWIANALVQVALFVVIARDYLLAKPYPWNWPAYRATVLRSIGLFLLSLLAILVIMVPVFFAGEFIMAPLNITALWPRAILVIGSFLGVVYLMTRVTTWAASAAVGRPQTLGESWQATRDASLKIAAGFLIQLLFFMAVFIVVIGGSGILLYAIDQIPSPERPITPGYIVVGLIQYVLGVMVSAIGAVYLTNVLKQTRA